MDSNGKILSTRRTYNKLVANEMMEDFALRFTAKRARIWSLNRIANTALGIVSFLVLEAIGGAITISFGFENAAWAILSLVFVIFLTGLPICYHAAKNGVDIDLLSRGAGFGYIGSTIASLIYASFTFIFFALEAAIMSMALQLLFDIPIAICYVISALVVLPLVTHGIAYISRFQVWSQPIWIVLQLVPLYFVFTHPDSDFKKWISYTGNAGEDGKGFNLMLFGAASAVLLSLVAQIGEQVDFLRFLPEKPQKNKHQWWAALVIAGPGWIIFGAMKLFLGSFLAYFALKQGIAPNVADDPAHMYNLAFSLVFENPEFSLLVACSFVVISQLKINVANAYAGSLAWSNFFSRVTHNHPGRVVWMVFNVAIALLLMELDIYQTIESMLSVYSVVVLAWLSSVVADLVINKPLGISPKHIEFKRSHLYDINPVGVCSMFIATFVGFTGHLGWYGETVQALASFIACGLPFITVPLIGYLTKGKYYLVDNKITVYTAPKTCYICENTFDQEDMTYCPAYKNPICSLCCSLDVRCGDKCRPEGTIFSQSHHFFKRFLNTKLLNQMTSSTAQFIYMTLGLGSVGASILFLIYLQIPAEDTNVQTVLGNTLIKTFFFMLIIIGIVSWLFILARSSNRIALNELRSQTSALATEIDAHESTSRALKDAKDFAESANQAKSRYLAGLSHELRTPLNVLLGYAQLLSQDADIPVNQQNSLNIIKRNGEHLADLIEGLLEISKIEAGRLSLHKDEFNLKAILQQLVDMFAMQAKQKGLDFLYKPSGNLPNVVATDKQRFRQVLINLISNAIKYTQQGTVTLEVSYRNEVINFNIIDTGMGIAQKDQETIFKPFEQIRNTYTQGIGGTGLGLTISRSLIHLMGGDITLHSQVGKGSTFNVKLMLPQIQHKATPLEIESKQVIAYIGPPKHVLVVDDDPSQQQLMRELLTPLGFSIYNAIDAKTGFEYLEEEHIDLILLDVRMPVMDGWEMLKLLREQEHKLPVVMVSANVRENDINLAAKGLHDAYIAKPFNLDILLAKIGELLNLSWQYKSKTNENNALGVDISIDTSINDKMEQCNKPTLETSDYEQLIGLAEIGFLSGFSEKLNDLQASHNIPDTMVKQLNIYVEQCNFPEIIQYLKEASHE
ncbi:ATP-binding protein [Agaribacter marinus]|uniref:histidine kinase n=1 Tax=Agaribacter marinus TaxID=1431249 RepID=A0AA37T0T2_9ALTE|nr:ATP-binding protein [Agaribacter marinus]GLR71655.1 hybrid sensor histidine kinase/response regulator [Agaribacter marinus]